MKKMKSLYLLMLLVAAMFTSCHEEVTTGPESLQVCRTQGTYEATIVNVPLRTDTVVEWLDPDMWVWCEITKAPEDAKAKGAPLSGTYLYFQRNDFPGIVLKTGMTVKFRIYYMALIMLDNNDFPFAFSPERLYYYGQVMPK